MKSFNVLITAASRRVSLIRSFRAAVEDFNGKVIAVDYDVNSPALFFAHKHYKVPLVMDDQYIPTIESIVEKENIALIIPTIDQELLLWAENRERLAKAGVKVSISDYETVKICNDKWETFEFFRQNGLSFPETYLPSNLTYDMDFPLFIKPRNGRGSIKAYKVKNKKELDFFMDYVPEPIVQSYVKGKEFTIDAFFSEEGEFITMVPRYRLVIRSGVSDRGRTFYNAKLESMIKDLVSKIKFRGAVNIQGKIYKDEILLFEINPRFSGGIQLTTASGVDFAEYLIREMNGDKLYPDFNSYTNGITMTSYEDSLFIDSRRDVSFFYTTDSHNIFPAKNKTKL